jgi:hypothetical protein
LKDSEYGIKDVLKDAEDGRDEVLDGRSNARHFEAVDALN